MASSLFKRSLILLASAVLAAALIFGAAGLSVLGSVHSGAYAKSLGAAASALAGTFPAASLGESEVAAAFVRKAAAASARADAAGGYRVTLILPDGTVVADSEADPRSMDNHRSRPEVAAALSGRSSIASRRSATLGERLLYAAAPVLDERGRTAGALRLALHEPSLERALVPARWAFAIAAAAFALAALGAAAGFSRMTARPLASLAKAARAYARGDASGDASARAAQMSVRRDDPEEIRLLATTLDSMAAEIGQRVIRARAQGKELEAILDAMSEAVLALDSGLRIKIANPAAAALFGLRRGTAGGAPQDGPSFGAGQGLLEATRSSDLQAVAVGCLESGEARKAEFSLFLPGERVFQAAATPLGETLASGAKGAEGVVVVLNDITELRRLERVRRDFVANVSHELRTPVQMVKGFAESLREGALAEPEQARRFVEIIERNASRMESLIGDLLSLASLEREGGYRLKAELSGIDSILLSAREAIGPKADKRGIELSVSCEAGLAARVDPGLLEQAVINLVDNAVKYSPPATAVSIEARTEGPSLVIIVRDHGIGIPARDLPRLFERFYRVDKARSRELGGTGLGLAIVRHIAMAHGGEVSVESWEGEGSVFRITIPMG